MKRLAVLVCASVFATAVLSPAADTPEGRAPRRTDLSAGTVADFQLIDQHGKSHQLHRAEAKVVVLFIGGNGCPIVRQCISKLRAVQDQFASQGVVVWMLNANTQDDLESIKEESEKFNVGSIPILKDDHQAVARALNVVRTAEAIAIDTKAWKILYRGPIDDQLTEGAQKPKAKAKYLETALTQFLAGQPVTRARVAVKGCLIQFDAAKNEGAGEPGRK